MSKDNNGKKPYVDREALKFSKDQKNKALKQNQIIRKNENQDTRF